MDKINRCQSIFVDYFNYFFEHDENQYQSRKQPQIFFKHIIRKYFATKWKLTQSEIADIERKFVGHEPNLSSIQNSIDQPKLPLNHIYQKGIDRFFQDIQIPATYDTLSTLVSEKIQALKMRGYLTQDIARNCRYGTGCINRVERKDSTVGHNTLIDIANNLHINYTQ